MTLPPDVVAGLLFWALLAGTGVGIVLRGRRLPAAALAALVAAGASGLWLGAAAPVPAVVACAALAALLGGLDPAAGSAPGPSRLGRLGGLGGSHWSGGSNVVASERW